MTESSILWRRLDTPGRDACRLIRKNSGWTIEGAAVFLHGGFPAFLAYRVDCDSDWRTLRGRIDGWIGNNTIAQVIVRTETGGWSVNGGIVPGLEHCVDLDLGFTPATNLIPVRRMELAEGEAAQAPAAWYELATGALGILHQRYERRPDGAYWYEAPDAGYAGLIEIMQSGFIRRYPGLWEAEM